MPFDNANYKVQFNLTGLISWLKQQPKETIYEYYDTQNCLAAQFNQACGENYTIPTQPGSIEKHRETGNFERVLELVAQPTPHTMLAALQRANRLR